MCRVLDVARSGYYAWLHQPLSEHAQKNARLLRLIRASFTATHGIYGAPRVFVHLRSRDEEEHRGLRASITEVGRERLPTRRSVGRGLVAVLGDKTDGMHNTVCSSSPARSRRLTPGYTAGDVSYRAPIVPLSKYSLINDLWRHAARSDLTTGTPCFLVPHSRQRRALHQSPLSFTCLTGRESCQRQSRHGPSRGARRVT